DSGACSKTDSITITTLPNDFIINDTSLCAGTSFEIKASGDTAFTYKWTPGIGLSDSNVITPIIYIDTTRTYTVTASYPTCPDIVKSVTVDIQPVPDVYLGPDTAKCQWDIFPINAQITPSWYNQYTYSWAPDPGLSSLNTPNVLFSGQKDTRLFLKVTTPAGCEGQDSLEIKVHKGNFAS